MNWWIAGFVLICSKGLDVYLAEVQGKALFWSRKKIRFVSDCTGWSVSFIIGTYGLDKTLKVSATYFILGADQVGGRVRIIGDYVS